MNTRKVFGYGTRNLFCAIAVILVLVFIACESPTDEPAHVHQWNAWTVTTAANCTTTGSQTRTCALDATHIETQVIAIDLVNGHDWGEWKGTVTCETAGTGIRVCSRDATHKEEEVQLQPLGHNYKYEETTAPTCTTAGVDTGTCTRDATHTTTRPVAINPTAHVWGDWIETATPTCTGTGVETRTCTLDTSHAETRIGAVALGHDWGNWVQTSETVETRNCIRSGCTASDTRAALPATKNFTATSIPGVQIAKKNFNAPAPLSSNINRNVIFVSDTTIQQTGAYQYRTMLIIIDDEGYGWESNGFVPYYGNLTVYDLAVPITVYANEGYGWYQVTENYYRPEEPPFDDSALGISFTMTQNWLIDSSAEPFNTTTSFIRMYWPVNGLYVNLSDVAQNPEEWSITTSGGTLTITLGAPKDEYLYSFDFFKTLFCSQGGTDLHTNNTNLKLLDLGSAATYNFFSLSTGCRGQGCSIVCQGYLLYANEDATITGYAYEGGTGRYFVYEMELKTGWNTVWKNYDENTISTTGVFGNHVLWRVSN